MKNKKQFPEEPVEARKQLLEDNCRSLEDMPIRRYFSKKELSDLKDEQVEIAITLKESEDKKKEYLANVKQTTDPLKKDQKELLVNIKNKYIDEDKQVYAFDNQEEGVMEFYDETGDCVYQRPLMPAERQASILTIAKTG